MLTLPDAFSTAVNATGHEPIWLVELGGVGRFFSSHALDFGRTWRLGEGLYIGGGWRLGDRRAAYSGTISENGMGRIVAALDDAGQSARIGSLTVDLLGHEGIGLDLDTLPLDNTPIRVLIGFRDLSYPEYVQLYLGVLDNTEETLTSYLLDVIDDTLRAHRDLSTPIGSLYFPGTPTANRGKAIPILIGRNTDVEALQIVGAAAGTLALTLSDSATALFMSELGATFPPTGTITVGSESGVTYTARSFVTINGITYLRLEGLTRGAPVTQNAGDAVTLTGYTNTYLVGYETGSVTAVRDDGVIVDTADYDIVVDSTSADRAVTTIEFDAAPTGLVTFDADGLNVVPETGITNGDFETGDETGWTEVGSAALVVSTGSTADSTSVYKGELTGSEDSDEDITNDISTTPGTYYNLEFDYRDNTTGNLVTNADFEDGLTGWTISTESANGTAVPQGDGGEFNSVSLRASNNADANFQTLLYQDITTTVSADYTLTFSYLGFAFFPKGGGTVYSYTYTRGGWRVGTDADDDAYEAQAASENTWPHLGAEGHRDYRTETINFTATTTTTRITFEGYGLQLGYVLYPLIVRGIALVQNTSLPTSTTSYAIGTAADDDAYASEVLANRYSWTRIRVAFQALTTSTRLTLRSQWFDTSCDSWFDNVQIRDGGRNPADAIAYVIDTFLAPDLERDTASFATAFDKLSAWQFGGALTAPGDSRARLDDMAWQCNSRIVVNTEGKLRLLVRDGIETEALLTVDADSLFDNTFQMRREPMDNIYTSFRIWYGRSSGETEDQQGFQASVSASPESTTHPSAALAELCAGAAAIYGSTHVLERRADMIRDLGTAHLLLEALVNRHTTRQYDISVRVFHRVGIQVEVGDYIELFYHRVNGGQMVLCEVLSKEVGPADVALKLRTVRDLGFFESWNFPLLLIEGDLFTEPWSA